MKFKPFVGSRKWFLNLIKIKAIQNYNKDISIIKDPYIQKILERIIDDEKVHVKIFTALIDSIKCNQNY